MQRGGDAGFTLMEVVVATVIATIAIIGLAYSFGTGRGMIERFEVARAALGVAQQRMEVLSAVAPADTGFAPGVHSASFILDGELIGGHRWTVSWYDDPLDGLAGGDQDSNPNDMRLVQVEVDWIVGGFPDTVRLTRLFPRP